MMYPNNDTRSGVFVRWLEHIGPEQLLPYVQLYVERGVVTRPSDLYKLGIRNLYQHPDIPEDVAFSVLEFIERAESVSVGPALYALLPDANLKIVHDIVSSPCSLVDLADRCSDFMDPKDLLEELFRLEQFGLEISFNPNDKIFDSLKETPFTGKLLFLEGPFSAPEKLVVETLTSLGAGVSDKITDDTDYVLSNNCSPEVKSLAKQHTVQIISEEDVAKMLGILE